LARQTHTAVQLAGPNPTLQPTAGSLSKTPVASIVADKEEVLLNGGILIHVRNSGAQARTITVTSVADDRNRTGDITAYSVAAGDEAMLGPFYPPGWMQASNGKLYFETSHAELVVTCWRLP
jgi:hypothetical protein